MKKYLSDEMISYPVDAVESVDEMVQYVKPVRERSKLANLHRLKKGTFQTWRKKQSKPEIEIVKAVPAQKKSEIVRVVSPEPEIEITRTVSSRPNMKIDKNIRI